MASEGQPEVLRPMILRSVTPASNEKVWHYLEGIEAAGETEDPEQYMDDNRSQTSYGRPLSPRSRSQALRSPPPRSQVSGEGYAQPHATEEDAESFDSNEQEKSTGIPEPLVNEPGPHDAPGPHYESFSSWGNKGALPLDDNSPVRVPYRPPNHENHWTNGYRTEQNGALMTPQTFDVPLETPTSPTGSRRQPTRSQATGSVLSTERASPKKAPSQADTQSPKSRVDVAPLSPPMSPTSPHAARSHITTRTKGTAYPPLPESRVGDEDSGLMSPKLAKTRSKAASVSPSDSASVAKVAPQMTGRTSGSRRAPSQLNKSHVPTDGPVDAAMLSPRSGSRQLAQSGTRSPPPASASGGHQSRPFSPYRHAPTQEDLLYAATRGRALFIPEDGPVELEEEKAITESAPSEVSHARSHVKTMSQVSQAPSKAPSQAQSEARTHAKTASQVSRAPSHMSKSPSQAGSEATQRSRASKTTSKARSEKTATARALSPDQLDEAEARLVEDVLASVTRTPRTSFYAPSALESDVKRTPYHDVELCVLFHQLNDNNVHELVKKAVRKAVRQRVKRLGMKYDNESIKEYVQTHQHHDPSSHEQLQQVLDSDEPPKWASDIKREIVLMQQRIESLGPKIENLRNGSQGAPEGSYRGGEAAAYYDDEEYEQTPQTQTINIQTQPTGTLAESLYQPPQTVMEEEEEQPELEFEEQPETPKPGHSQSLLNGNGEMSEESPGQHLLEEELYKLRVRKTDGQSHRSWELGRTDDEHSYVEQGGDVVPTIPGSDVDDYDPERRVDSPPLPPLPEHASTGWNADAEGVVETQPWQKIHAQLLQWAVIWQTEFLDAALNSTLRGNQVSELALSVWTTQTYKRYVRSKLTDSPQGVVDRLFVPPHLADTISTCVFNGRHGEACGLLRSLWEPFGLEGMPRLIVVLAKHRTDDNHWVVHRFSLPDGALTTYDSYPERTLPDGRPLGWWFAIRIAWPNASYPSPDNLLQKMVRLHRPMQLPIDNSVAAAGIWRNILMGSRAERSLDLERLRDLINTEVKNLRQRKQLGKLSINAPRPAWEEMS